MTSMIHTSAFNTISAIDQWMKVIGSNVTGATVNGYKGETVHFGQVLEQMIRGPAKATDGYGSVNAIARPDSGIQVVATTTDFSQGSIVGDGDPTHMAIDGDGFFILSRVPVPRTMDDLTFTRDGSFHFEFLQGDLPGTGTYRLVNNEGLFVMGHQSTVDPNVRPFGTLPEESQGTDLASFTTRVTNGGDDPITVPLQNIQLDLVRNPDALNNWVFTPEGQLQVKGGAPRDLADNEANMHITLARFANAQGLRRTGGNQFKYELVAGQIFSGQAGDGGVLNNDNPSRVVGNSNTIKGGALEASNTSINTTMPVITLAQKSFSASSKLVTVGNTMIDDVNQLVK